MHTERPRPKVPDNLLLKLYGLFFELQARDPNIPDPYEGYPNGFVFLLIYAVVLFFGGVLARFVS
jgi:hypothetical protein